MTIKATYLGSNGWIIHFPNKRIIIDPWIAGSLVFPPGEWFFKGTLSKEIKVPEDINLILITQGLPDHCHLPSLEKFSKDIDVICSKSAYTKIKELGYKSIKILEPGENLINQGIRLEATEGAPVPQKENGYIIEVDNESLYIEPHGFLDKKIEPRKLKAVISPTINLNLPIFGSFIKGADIIPELIKKFNPNYILSSTTGGDAKFSGLLNRFISIRELDMKLDCELIQLKSMQSVEI